MAIRSSGYFNSPQFAQAASNLAGLFAPPSGSDAAGWAAANAKKEEAGRLAQLFTMAQADQFNQQQFDRMGAAAGQWTPNQSYYAVDEGNAVTRRGQDVTAATSIQNNQLDNQTGLLGKLYSPVGQGEIRPELPGGIASLYGMPNVTVPAVAGAPKPLTEAEVKGGIISGMSPDEQRAIGFGSTPVETVVTPAGPRIQTRLDAIGEAPHEKPSGPGMSVTLPDGTVVATGGKTTEAQDKNAYAAQMAEGATLELLDAFDTGKLPTGSDFQLQNARRVLPEAAAPLLAPNMTPEGQRFYQNLSSALPYQLMTQSGQAVTEQEYARKLAELVPVPGEDPAVTASKRRQLEVYMEAVKNAAGPAWGRVVAARQARDAAKTGTAPVDPAAAPAAPVSGTPDGTIIENDAGERMIRRAGKWEPM